MNTIVQKTTVVLVLFLGLNACEKFETETQVDTFFHVKVDDANLPVWIKGNTASNKLLIFINGGPGLTSLDIARADLFQWSDRLEEEVAMVYYDQRGCGNAQGKLNQNKLTVEQYVTDLDAIILVLSHQYPKANIYLMGHSFGGFVGASYLLTANLADKISGWVCIDGAYNFDYDLSWQYRKNFLSNIAREEIDKGLDTMHWNAALDWVLSNPRIETRQQKKEWGEFIGNPGERIIPEENLSISLRQYLGIGFASSYNPFPAYLSGNLEIVNDRLNADVEGVNLIQRVNEITLPSLFIWGRYDDLITPEEGQVVFDNLGTAEQDKYFKLFENSSHEPNISAPNHFKEEVIEFVSKY